MDPVFNTNKVQQNSSAARFEGTVCGNQSSNGQVSCFYLKLANMSVLIFISWQKEAFRLAAAECLFWAGELNWQVPAELDYC